MPGAGEGSEYEEIGLLERENKRENIWAIFKFPQLNKSKQIVLRQRGRFKPHPLHQSQPQMAPSVLSHGLK